MKDSVLMKCLVVSAALHAVAITVLFAFPLHFKSNFFSFLGKSQPTNMISGAEDEISILKKEAFLEEVFGEFITLGSSSEEGMKTPPLDTSVTAVEERALSPHALRPGLLLPDDPQVGLQPLPVIPLEISESASPERIDTPVVLIPPGLTIEPVQPVVNPFEGLVDPSAAYPSASEQVLDIEFLPSQEKVQFKTPSPVSSQNLAPGNRRSKTPDVSLHANSLPTADPSLARPPLSLTPIRLQQSRTTLPLALPPLAAYGVPVFNTIEWNDVFDLDIKTLPRQEGGYIFSLTFIPKADLTNHRMKQNYYFLIDRSNSIEKHRYQTFKKGVSRALASLKEGDFFNIIIFDSTITRFHEKPLPYNKKNQILAEEFLEKEPAGNYGAATDIYSSLGKIIPSEINEEEAHTAILISDGDSKLKPEKQRSLINAWVEANCGKVTLYTAAVGQGNNLGILDLLGTVSHGALLYSDTHTGFPRKLAKLILTIQSPIAKELSFFITANDPEAHIQLYPVSSRLPNLLSDHPFVLYGMIDKLSDFNLVLEGRNKGQILSIQKNIAFANARPGNRLLSKEWDAQQAHLIYEKYLQEGKPALLIEAQKLLSNEPAHSRR